MSDHLIRKAEQLEASARELRAQADNADARDCGCEVAKTVAGAVARTAAVAVVAATTGIVLPTV
ncbi:hypothetical protein [Sagittula sp. S175]|uniref:hypothetical protein n=1 Tax=Sagittula sp. S175 TaxID=3415129 RepID=UPI003C7999C8